MAKYKTDISRNEISSKEYSNIYKEYFEEDVSIALERYINETNCIPHDIIISVNTIFNEHESYPVQMGLLISPSDSLIECCVKNNISIDYSIFRGGHQRKQKRSYCYFSISGENFDPMSLLPILNVDCYNSYKKGDDWMHGRKRDHSNMDVCRFNLSDNTISELFDKIMYALEDKRELLCQMRIDNALSYMIEAVVYLKDNRKFVNMYPSQAAMTFFHEIGAGFDFDIYYL